MTRGLTEVELITPNCALAAFVLGLPNCGWLNVLKNSVRNCNDCASWMLMSLPSDISQLFWPGPGTIPSPELPNPVAVPAGGEAPGAGKENALAAASQYGAEQIAPWDFPLK